MLVHDEHTGEPVKLLGVEIYRDRRVPAAKPVPKRDKAPGNKRARAG